MPGLLDRLLRRRTHQLKVPFELANAAADHLVEMDARLEALAEMPGLEAFSQTRRLPNNFLELWEEALAAYDRYLAVMTGPGGLAVRCTAGCDACCHEVPTGVQAIELLAIYERYREFPDFADLHNRACTLADQLTELLAQQAPGEQQVDSSSPEFARAILAYRSKHLPCVFLGADSRCRIYDRRPIPCRMHFALTEPQWCAADDPHAEDSVTPNLEPPADMLVHMKTIARRLGLGSLSPTLFQGLGVLGGHVMQTKRIGRDKAIE